MPNFCLWKGTWDLAEPDSAGEAFEEPIPQIHHPKKPPLDAPPAGNCFYNKRHPGPDRPVAKLIAI